jgi:hypothetical protein
MLAQNYYQLFQSFIFRTPVFGRKVLNEKEDYFESKEILNNRIFLEALFIASPALLREIIRFKKGTLKEEDLLKCQISILKYYTRMTTRCTPFGLFAGCGLGNLGEKSKIILSKTDKFKSSTRLDMNYLCSFIQEISTQSEIKKQIKFYTNTSLYKSGSNLRYTEYRLWNTQRKYSLSQVEGSTYLEIVLEKTKYGSTIDELAKSLVNEEVSLEEAEGFIKDLIDSQIIIGELDPPVTGDDLLQQVISSLEKIEGTGNLTTRLKRIQSLLMDIDKRPIGRSISSYDRVKNELQQFKTRFDEKYLFQSDLLINKKEASISNKIAEEVNKALSAFNKLTISNESQFLRKFRTDFYNKYEDEEIPLVMALDVETGIGFGYTEAQKGDVSPLVDGLILPRKQLVTKDLKIDVVQDLLIKKYESFLKDDSCTEVRITEKDLVSLREDWDDLPPTLSSIIEVLRSDDSQYGPLILMRNAVGPSAANLLGRFCFLDKEIKSFVKEITRKEEKLIPQKLFAEIVHLPESRMGNILMRPILRSYEIPYLAKASVGAKKTIPLQDIMISVTQGKRIKLRSRKLGIEIIPRLSSAHNFSNNSLPIYHFLCALQTQGLRNNIGFRWGALLEDKSFLPRVRYNNVVFFTCNLEYCS